MADGEISEGEREHERMLAADPELTRIFAALNCASEKASQGCGDGSGARIVESAEDEDEGGAEVAAAVLEAAKAATGVASAVVAAMREAEAACVALELPPRLAPSAGQEAAAAAAVGSSAVQGMIIWYCARPSAKGGMEKTD